MEKDFIKRSLKASTITALILTPVLLIYFGISFTLGFMAGAVWNIVNVFLLSRVFAMIIQPASSNKKWGVTAGILKFPVLYGIGYATIRYTAVSLYGIMFGFSLILVVFVLKILGMYYFDVLRQKAGSYGRNSQ